MTRRLILSIPMALTWLALTANLSLEAFGVGFVVGFAILTLLNSQPGTINWRRLPDQTIGAVLYSVILARDIWLSGVDVAKKVIQPQMPLHPGIIAVSTQDQNEGDLIAALSAHGITITPGELVVDFDEARMMFVHCLDAQASGQSADAAQTRRLRMLQRIFG